MKTIQEYLKECNRKEVIDCYIYKYVFNNNLMNKEYKNITCGKIIERYTAELNKCMDNLITIEPKKDNSEIWIFVTIHATENFYNDDIEHLLIKKSDLFSNEKLEDIDSLSYILSDFEETLSFYVADTYLTQYNLTDLIADFLYESSWTGFNHEDLEKNKKELNGYIKETEDGKGKSIPAEDFFKKLGKKYGFEFEKRDPRQEKAYHKYMEHCNDYNKICKKIELEKLKNCLINNSAHKNKEKSICK